MNVVIGAKTDPGRRPNNEDQLAVVDVHRYGLRADGVLVIADGMGGRSFGEKASAAAVETVQDTLIEMLSQERGDAVDTGEALASALRKANARVYELGRGGDDGQGMGTTCVAAVIQGEALSVAHAGDSRAYLLRDGKLKRLTDDHSYVAEQVRAGAISEESARRSRFRNVITRAVGIGPTITPDVARYPVQPGDHLLLCTDGLTNMVPEDEIAQTLQYAPSPQAAAERLIHLANRNGGKDNITAVVARLEVSNRTERLRAQDMARLEAARPRLEPVDRTQQMRPEDMAATKAPPAPRRAESAPREQSRRPSVPLPLWPAVSALLLLLLLGVTLYFVQAQRAASDQIRALRSAARSAPQPTVGLADLTYAPPALFYVRPVQGGLLSLNDADGSLTVVTESGQVVRLARDGSTLAEFPLPDKNPEADVLPAVPSEGDHHFAVDPQGNLYDADAADHRIYKYRPNGDLIGKIPGFESPAALAVAADGTIYVIDAERLKVVRPHPPGYRPPAQPFFPAPAPDLYFGAGRHAPGSTSSNGHGGSASPAGHGGNPSASHGGAPPTSPGGASSAPHGGSDSSPPAHL
ncbi:MAG: Stp1/IreP family PP2C-type Ser/Thr phosphatase [Armatimonadetes bacterium]|nr:Stp1/IreP family PP2C-type Ser/Thr phosphatase [Armatimonadota bacterium]